MKFEKTEIYHLTALGLLAVLQFFLLLGHYALWDIDEGMHAYMAKHMLLSGDWITPVFNGEPFFDKPALFNWLGAAAFALLGFTDFAARLPAALAGLGCVILTYLIGRRAFGPTAGFLAGVVLCTSLEVAIVSRIVQYDMPFTFFTTLALYVFCTTLLGEKGNERRFIWFYVAVALAVLTKGPLGLLLPAMVIGLYVLLRGRWSLLLQMRIPLGVLIFFAIITPWYYLIEKANPGYLEYFVLRQHFANFLGDVDVYRPRHPEAWYFYAPVLIAGLFPWSFLLPQSIVNSWRKAVGAQREYAVLFLIWLVAVFVFFSAATSKLTTYIVPVFPAAALFIGRYCQVFIADPAQPNRRGMLGGLLCAFLLLLGMSGFAVLNNPWAGAELKYGLDAGELNLVISVIAALLGTALLAAWLSRRKGSLVAMTAITPFIMFFLTLFVIPDVMPYRSSRDIGLAYDRMLPPGEKMVFSGKLLDGALFYSGREGVDLRDPVALREYLTAPGAGPAILVSRTRDPAEGLKTEFDILQVIGNKAIISGQTEDDEH